MNDYAAVWSRGEGPTEPFVVGRVAVEPGRLRLEGQASDGRRCSREIAADEIRSVRRTPKPTPWGQRAGLRVELASGEPVVFTAVLGVAASVDLLDAVELLIRQARAARLDAQARQEEATALRAQARHQRARAQTAWRRSRRRS